MALESEFHRSAVIDAPRAGSAVIQMVGGFFFEELSELTAACVGPFSFGFTMKHALVRDALPRPAGAVAASAEPMKGPEAMDEQATKEEVFRRPAPGTQPKYLHEPYQSSRKRAPTQPLVVLPHTLSETTGPILGPDLVAPGAADLTRQHHGAPLGERIIVGGRVLDDEGRPLRRTLVEIWQANAAGRYLHSADQHDAPLDANFTGCGHTLTDEEGRYRFITIKPGSYPWRNHYNAWRPAHIHFSVFGPAFLTRLVTQMYFPGDPLLEHDPIFNCVSDKAARDRLIAQFDWEATRPEWALGYRFDIVLRGRNWTPMENLAHGE